MGGKNGELITIIMVIVITQFHIYMNEIMERKQGMTYGINNQEDFLGIEKLLNINQHFSWNDVKYIEKMCYYIDLDEYGEQISYLKILFIIELPNKIFYNLLVKFNAINNLYINNIGGKYNQIVGFEIIDNFESGWESKQRYVVRDYENATIEFCCKSIEIVSVNPFAGNIG